MTRAFVFADEAGDFDFSRKPNVSRYFILCTIALDACDIGAEMLALRRKLIWDGADLGDYFHATKDSQSVRDQVFDLICRHKLTVHATIMEKSKAQPQVRSSRERFYKYGWLYHFRFASPKFLGTAREMMITAASLGTKKERSSFLGAIQDVMGQTVSSRRQWKANFCPAASDPCIQVADYCAWAIQRKWERSDTRSYDLIKDRVIHEYDMWKHGIVHHY